MTFYRLSIALLPIAVFDHSFFTFIFLSLFPCYYCPSLNFIIYFSYVSPLYRLYFLLIAYMSHRPPPFPPYLDTLSFLIVTFFSIVQWRNPCSYYHHLFMPSSLFPTLFYVLPDPSIITYHSIPSYCAILCHSCFTFIFVYFLVNLIFPVIITFSTHPSYVALIHSLIRP